MAEAFCATFHAGESFRGKIAATSVVIAGWTGRDPTAVQRHIEELEALGVRGPSTTPVFYHVSASRLTTSDTIEVSGSQTSGEVEFVLLRADGRLWVGVGSDHTDRELEKTSVSLSKQICDKPIAPEFWAFDELADHWDDLILRSHIVTHSGTRSLYQEGRVTSMLNPSDLLGRWGNGLAEGALMFGGTLSVLGGIRPARRFEFELSDPPSGRRIVWGYNTVCLPVGV